MRVNPIKVLNLIKIISSIFGVIALTIAILTGNDIIRAICAILLFFLGWIAAKIHYDL